MSKKKTNQCTYFSLKKPINVHTLVKKNTLLLKNFNHHLNLQQPKVIISLITNHHNKYNNNNDERA